MLSDNPFLQLVPARARTYIVHLQNLIWGPPVSLEAEWTGCGSEHLSFERAAARKRTPIRKPFHWGREYDQAWFRFELPPEVRGGNWFFEWKDQGEATAYIDGVPWAGLDRAHCTCRIPASAAHLWVEALCLDRGILQNPGGRSSITAEGCPFRGAVARQRNEEAWHALHDFEVLVDVLKDEYQSLPGPRPPFGSPAGWQPPLNRVSPLCRRLSRHLERAMDAFAGGGAAAMRKSLRAAYRDLSGRPEFVRCRLTGHAHIDLVWLWTEAAAEFKAVHTFSTMTRLMDEYPEFRFGYSQPASYRAVERRAPGLMEQVRRRIAAGAWEPVGAAEVEFDTQIPCGEALARGILVGQKKFVDLQGTPSRILWLPDVFGYTGALPQILKQSGVDYFFTSKLPWGSITHFPYSSFVWRGSDGSEIVSNVLHGCGYNANVLPSELRACAREYRQADVHDEVLLPCGFGDGGGGTTPEMCERTRRMSDLAGVPASSWGRIDEFFDGLNAVRDRLPVFRGELYLQYHRGVTTTHGDLKAAFRGLERALQILEASHALAGCGPIDETLWQRLLFAQFHDYIPGSSVAEVYAEGLPELRAHASRALELCGDALAGDVKKRALFNPLPLPRHHLHEGRPILLPPLSAVDPDRLTTRDAAPVTATKNGLSNGRVEVRFDSRGRISRLAVDGAAIAQTGPLAECRLFDDLPHGFDAWDIDRAALTRGRALNGPCDAQFQTAAGTASCVVDRPISEQSRIRIRFELRVGVPVLFVTCEVDWHERDTLMKLVFPTGYQGEHARYGAPFGSTLRSQHPGKPFDEAQWEVAGSRYAMVGDDTEEDGLFVATEAKYGWTCRSGTLGLSLLRGARLPDGSSTGGAHSPSLRTLHSDQGRHTIRLAVGRFRADAPREEQPAALAETLFTPAVPIVGRERDAGFQGLEGGDSLVPCWAVPETDSAWVLRLHETLGRRGTARLQLADDRCAEAIDLAGRPVRGVLRGATIHFSPYQVVSIRVARKDGPRPRADRT
jgi:alpha-mannosidase